MGGGEVRRGKGAKELWDEETERCESKVGGVKRGKFEFSNLSEAAKISKLVGLVVDSQS